MDLNEMIEEFDLLYNNINSNMAPGLLKEEIVSFLNKSQEQLVEALYSKYENSEEYRKKLSELVRESKGKKVINNDYSYSDNIFELPNDILYIVWEGAKLNTEDPCLKDKILPIVPVTHDNLHRRMQNPFIYNENKVLRLDIFTTTKASQLLYSNQIPIKEYQIRYIKRPNEMIYSSDGQNTNCELNPVLHRTVVEIAAKLASAYYKQ